MAGAPGWNALIVAGMARGITLQPSTSPDSQQLTLRSAKQKKKKHYADYLSAIPNINQRRISGLARRFRFRRQTTKAINLSALTEIRSGVKLLKNTTLLVGWA